MEIRIDTQVHNIKGDLLDKSFPSYKEVIALPTLADGNPDMNELPRETIKNMLLNCLASYGGDGDKKAVFSIYDLGSRLIKAEQTLEVSEQEQELLVDAVMKSVYKEITNPNNPEEKKFVGVYKAFSVAQVLQALGVSPEKIEEINN